MKRSLWMCLAALMLCMVLSVTMLTCAMGEGEHEKLTAAVNKLLKQYHATGAAVLVAKDGEVVFEHYYGMSRVKEKMPVTADTYFRMASVSKMVSAVAVMKLVDEGKLELDRDLSDYYGYEIRNPKYKNTPITLRMVMSHTSSFMDNGGYTSQRSPLETLISLKKGTRGSYNKYEPGTKYVYANLNGGLLGSLIEKVTGMNASDYIVEEVFKPLGIHGAYHTTLLEDIDNMSCSYKANGQLAQHVSLLLRKPFEHTCDAEAHFRRTAGGLVITPMGLCKIGMLLEQEGTLNGVTILKPETVREMMSDQKGKGGITGSSIYGLNINRIDNLVKDRMIYGHQGLNANLLNNCYFDPENHFVFVMTTNGVNSVMSNHIGSVTRKIFAECWSEFCK